MPTDQPSTSVAVENFVGADIQLILLINMVCSNFTSEMRKRHPHRKEGECKDETCKILFRKALTLFTSGSLFKDLKSRLRNIPYTMAIDAKHYNTTHCYSCNVVWCTCFEEFLIAGSINLAYRAW